MIWALGTRSYKAILVSLCVLITIGAAPSGAEVSDDVYVAIGASETVGVGVSPTKRYANIVARVCGWRPVVNGRSNEPSLNLHPNVSRATFVTWFVDVNNARFETADAESKASKLLDALSPMKTRAIVILVDPRGIPGLRFMPDITLERQLILNDFIRREVVRRGLGLMTVGTSNVA